MASSMTWLSPLEELTTATLLYSHQLPLKSKPLQSLFDKKVTLSSFIRSQSKSLNMHQNRSPCFASKFLTSRSKQAWCMCALFTESERKEEELITLIWCYCGNWIQVWEKWVILRTGKASHATSCLQPFHWCGNVGLICGSSVLCTPFPNWKVETAPSSSPSFAPLICME